MGQDCIFCKIAAGEIPAKTCYEDEEFLAFADINPQAPVHLLVIPRRHVADVAEAAATDPALIGRIFSVIERLARERGLVPDGFRVVCNTGPQGGQTVKHLHFHILGGRFMGWPPG
ncbi:MAG: histidine triad nucleotide-binding protein [Bacillota bacterium]